MDASFAEVIDEDFLSEVFPKEKADFDAALKEDNVPLFAYAFFLQKQEKGYSFCCEDAECNAIDSKKIDEAFTALTSAFAAKFDGLTLCLSYQEVDANSTYWTVDGLYVLSEGAKQLGRSNWHREFFVHS